VELNLPLTIFGINEPMVVYLDQVLLNRNDLNYAAWAHKLVWIYNQ
jgi:hypothetical protein